MTARQFAAWLDAMREVNHWSERRCAKELGVGVNQPTRWKRNGAPKYIGLACAAVAVQLPPWAPPAPKRKKDK
jgi:hypothetical protein